MYQIGDRYNGGSLNIDALELNVRQSTVERLHDAIMICISDYFTTTRLLRDNSCE